MLNKCKCGCNDIRLCVISRITQEGKCRFEKFSYYCENCGYESEQCSIEYPVDMTLKEYIPWRNAVINATKGSWNSIKYSKEPKTEASRERKNFLREIVGKIKNHHKGSVLSRKRGAS